MSWAKWILAYLFDCVHPKTSWPQRGRTGFDYVCCLDCGREFPYSTQLMSIVSKEEQMKERSRYNWAKPGNVRSAPMARSHIKVSIDTLVR
jgi:hypothetical protein